MSGRSGQRHRARTSAKARLLSWTLASLVTTLAKVRPEMQLGEHMHVESIPGVLTAEIINPMHWEVCAHCMLSV